MTRILRLAVYLVGTLALIFWLSARQGAPAPDAAAVAPAAPSAQSSRAPVTVEPADLRPALPREAIETLQAIERGGPFPYPRDGIVFQNRERRLPARPRGYYREYTVPTPGSRDRGARRIVTGGEPPEVFYYTDDHYRSFQPVEWPP